MRVGVVISSLGGGGAERVLSILCNYWAQKGWEVTVFTFGDGSQDSLYAIDPRVRIEPLSLLQKSRSVFQSVVNNVKRTLRIRRAIRESGAEVVVSFIDTANVRVLLATRFMDVPVIVSERTDPACHRIGRGWNFLRRLTYPWADAVVLQSREVEDFFPASVRRNVRIIPNPVLVPETTGAVDAIDTRPMVVTVGRLAEEKCQDMLVEAFARAAKTRPQWHLGLVGDGPMREVLARRARELGIEDRVRFFGWVDNVHDYLAQADLFVLSSAYEGFPNALCEAMASGVPVISTDCSGVATILENGRCGKVVPRNDMETLADALAAFMDDADLRESMARKGSESVRRFSLECVMDMWESLMQDVVR